MEDDENDKEKICFHLLISAFICDKPVSESIGKEPFSTSELLYVEPLVGPYLREIKGK
jgi:hypothetical protein